MDINIDALYNILNQNQGDVNDAMGSKKKTIMVTSDPLALIAEKTNVSRSKDKVVVSSDSKGSEADDFKASLSSTDEKISKFCGMKGIKREFSVARTPQQNGIAKRKNRTLVEAARTMLADSLLPIPFWAENTYYRFYVTFCCPVTILNTLDTLGKFDGKADEGFLVGYSVSSKAFRVFNSRTRIVQETLHINFLENQPNIAGSGPTWLFDIDSLTHSINYQPVIAGNQPNSSAGIQENFDAEKAREGNVQQYVLFPLWSTSFKDPQNTNNDATFKVKELESAVHVSPSIRILNLVTNLHMWILLNPDDPDMPALEDITYSDDEEDVGAEADFSNLETNITVSPIPITRVHKDHPITQIISDLSSAPQTRSMTMMVKEQGFEDPDYRDKVYKVVKALYGLHQAPKAWYETLANYLLENDFQRGKINQTLFIKKQKGDILLVQVYVDDIIFGSTNKNLCKAFEKLMKYKFQNFGLKDGKSAGTPIDTEKHLLKDPDGEDVDVHTYRSMIGSLMYLTSSRPDIMFAVCACVCFQVTPKASNLHAVKRIFRYLMGKPHLGLWYPKDLPFNLVTYSDSDYAGASLDRKSTTGGCQFLGIKLVLLGFLIYTLLDASEGFEQIIDFLNASVIQYALMVNPTIYVSCIKQFWSSVSIKKMNDVVRLQALIDRRTAIITKDTVQQALQLDDAESVDCLPNEEIFAELVRMGYEKPSTKLPFYKAFFSAQWNLVRNVDSSSKFYMYLIFLQLMINAQIANLSSHNTKYTSPALIQKVFANMRRVGKGFSGVDTLLFEGMLVPQQVNDDVADDVADVVVEAAEPTLPLPTTTPPPLQQKIILSTSRFAPTPPPSPHQSLIDYKAKAKVRRLEKKSKLKASRLTRLRKVGIAQRIKSSADTVMDDQDDASKQGRKIAKTDADEDVTLEKVVAEVPKDADVQGRIEASQAQAYHLDLEHAQKVLSMQDDEAEPSELKKVIKVATTAKLMTKVVTAADTTITAAPSAARRRKGIVIRDPKEIATPSVIVHSESKSKDKVKGILVEEPKPLKKQAQIEHDEAYARELEAELNANIKWNEVIEQHFNSIVALLEKGEEDLEEEASKAIKRKNESSKEKAAKKQKLNKEVEELKTHLQIIPNDEDDVYTEATPLALKVPVVYYQIHTEHNKPYYKIIRADGAHQLFLSFISLLRNFDREDLEML
nr:hypothetical protein [Tanacetum cinerariifolium]